MKQAISDEQYIVGLCDGVLEQKASRGHRFDFLRGDPGKDGRRAKLPVDAYYPKIKLVIEYRERQHGEAVRHFDKRRTVSGVTRGEQRKRYDQLRRDVLPRHGITLLELDFDCFEHDGRKKLRRRNAAADQEVIRRKLARLASV